MRLPQAEGSPMTWLAEVAHGRRTLRSLASPERGFAYALHRSDASGEDPARDDEGLLRHIARVCEASDPLLARLEARLALHHEPGFEHVPVTCDGLVCTAPGPMEFATTLRFVFERPSRGGVDLVAVYEVEEVALPEEIARMAWTWAEANLAQAPARCDAR